MKLFSGLFLAPLVVLAVSLPRPVQAAIVGTNCPATPLTPARIAMLPTDQQPAWTAYLNRSEQQRRADQNYLRAEMQAQGLTTPLSPPTGQNAKSLSLKESADWYGSAEARQVADNVVSYQTPAGGWSKNLNFTKRLRAPGEAFATVDNEPSASAGGSDQPTDLSWHYVGTFDNDATITELRFLGRVVTAAGTNGTPYRAACERGFEYVFKAQYPNGGWPQVWPLQGGYHDTITINDDAMLHILEFLQDVAGGRNEFSFVPRRARKAAAASFQRGLKCLLAAQIVANGQRTVWCQQYDAITLQPASARNYEMPALVSSESAAIVQFLMSLPNPDSNEVAAVHTACAWFEKNKIMGVAYKSGGSEGRKLVAAPGSGPLWARFYEIGTNRPIFGDRDKTIHDDVNELSRERRNGYGWYRDTPKPVLVQYANWSKSHPQN